MNMEQSSSSSKVTVEYFDPYGVYQLLSPGLLPRLPLRNLHWESHAGPLRSIQSLHIDLVPAAEARPLSIASTTDLSRVKSSDTASGDDGFRVQTLGSTAAEKDRPDSRSGTRPIKGRRHQIPGLRQTPYLKIFFLRCDDNETYKLQARKQIREWIKDHTPPAQTTTKLSAQENHDAYEWLIVHIIVPNTAAATQAPTSSKGSSTILEKLRADFNGPSKSSPDRIAQIRIGVNDVPYDLLPRVVPAIPGSYTETPKEHQESWADLISKLKSLILASFDMRVSQYEDDIKEKDAQRTLPGWNFCTFFVLKEGLARGFESVGLVEDALVGYDELAVGLDAVIREQASAQSGAAHGGAFLPYTEELKLQVTQSRAAILRDEGIETETDGPIDMQSLSGNNSTERDEIPLSASRKNYRELILANDISIFDFRCYLFARQLSLLLRMGNAWSSQEELLAKLKEQRESNLQGVAARNDPTQPAEEGENLTLLGEICRRSLDFITSISRVMREDLLASCSQSNEVKASSEASEGRKTLEVDQSRLQAIHNVVSSFTFSVAQQILAQTSTKSLPIPPSTLAPLSNVQGQEPKTSIPEPKTMMHPARSTSLMIRPSRDELPPSPGIFPGRRASIPDQGALGKSQQFLKAGLEELAAHRAELYLLSRVVLENLGKGRSWPVGWEAVSLFAAKAESMEEVSLSDDPPQGNQLPPQSSSTSLHGISSELLRAALTTQDDFHRLYETLTDKALRHFTVASRTQSLQSTMADLAILEFYLGDYAAAASYFYRMTPFYGEGGWEQIEITMLFMYTKCLKELGRNEEYIRVALKLLGRFAAVEKDRSARNLASLIGAKEDLSVDGHLTELLTVVPMLQHDINIPLQTFFANAEVEGPIRFHDERDSFALVLKLKYLLADDLEVETVRVRMVSTVGDQGREIWLETGGPVLFTKGTVRVHVHTNAIVPGTYSVKQITLRASKMILSYEVDNARDKWPFLKSSKLLLYQRPQSVNLGISASRYLHLSRTRTLELTISSGWNVIQKGELHLRAATAGLRLQTSDIALLSGEIKITKSPEAGVIRFGEVPKNEVVKIRLPFNLESEVPEIALKLEMSYVTEFGTFLYAAQPKMAISLPLGVNVQDVFKQKALFSKFSITSATGNPLRLLSSRLEDSDVFEATNGGSLTEPVTVFQRQPATMLYKIVKKGKSEGSASNGGRGKSSKATLSLVLHYICLDEEIQQAVTQSLNAALEDTQYGDYSRLIIPTVLQQLNSNLPTYDVERTALLNEIPTSAIADTRWRDHFLGLGQDETTSRDRASLLADFLRSWQEKNPIIPLVKIELNETTLAEGRSIIIPVDVPPMNAVNTADLRLDGTSSGGKIATTSGECIAVSGQPLSGSLKITSTRIWDTDASSKVKDDSVDFAYELSAASDTWIIGGKRKGHFTVRPAKAGPQKPLRFPVLLIPLKEGYIPYPNLEIRPLPVSKSPGQSGAQEDVAHAAVTCEVDYKNVGETIRVISNARKTTLSLDASGPQGGAWLLESERRGGDGDVLVG